MHPPIYNRMSGAGYDPKIIERFADQLERKADTVRVGCAVVGGIFGTFVGAVPLTPLKSVWGVPAGFGVVTIIVGALLGVLVGYVIGEGRSFRYRVQAQSAIFQLEIERRVTSAVAEAVSQASGAATPAAPEGPKLRETALAEPPLVAPIAPPLTRVEEPSMTELIEAAETDEAAEETDTGRSEPGVHPLTPVETPPAVEPLLRPPGAPAPPLTEPPLSAPPLSPAPETSTPDELPPLSPAANG